MYDTVIDTDIIRPLPLQHFSAGSFPTVSPVHWLRSHFAVGGWSPLQRLSGMLTAHMTRIAPRNGFTWHPHRGLEIYTWVLEGRLYHEDTTGGKGEITAGELQRMFSGDWIQHQELNPWNEPARVIQIWFAADPQHRGLSPHYQQVGQGDLPAVRTDQAVTYSLIGDDSPVEQHMNGRLTATTIQPGGRLPVVRPYSGEDLFLYVTDGAGELHGDDGITRLGQYDVILARPDAPEVTIAAEAEHPLHFLNFYLPRFLPHS